MSVSVMRGRVSSEARPGYRGAHPGYACWKYAGVIMGSSQKRAIQFVRRILISRYAKLAHYAFGSNAPYGLAR